MKVIAAAYSTKGIREHNEDSFILNTKIGGAGIEDSMAVFESEELPLLFAAADRIAMKHRRDGRYFDEKQSCRYVQNLTIKELVERLAPIFSVILTIKIIILVYMNTKLYKNLTQYLCNMLIDKYKIILNVVL